MRSTKQLIKEFDALLDAQIDRAAKDDSCIIRSNVLFALKTRLDAIMAAPDTPWTFKDRFEKLAEETTLFDDSRLIAYIRERGRSLAKLREGIAKMTEEEMRADEERMIELADEIYDD